MPSRPPAAPQAASRSVRVRAVLVLLAAILLSAQTQGVAVAEHGGRDIGSFMACDRPVSPPRCTSVGDNRLHFVAFDDSLTDGLATAMRASMAEDYDAVTRLTLIEQDEVSSVTDVIAFSADYGDNGAAGWVFCPGDAPQGINSQGHRWCRQQEMHFNLNPRYGLFFDDTASLDHIACHELGHTLGLRHWGNPPQTDGPVGATCMNANTPNGPTSLHQTDIDHINDYPYRTRWPTRRLEIAVPMTAPGPAVAVADAPGSVHGNEVERPATLADLVGTADAVVRGRVEYVEAGRVYGPASRPLVYAAATVRVEELIAGSLPAGHATTLTLEVPLFDGPEALDRVRAELTGGERLLFLRNKAVSAARAGLSLADQLADRDFYRLVTFDAQLVEIGGMSLLPESESRALTGFDGRPWDTVMAEIRSAAQ